VKSDEEIMELLEAFDLVGSYRGAGELAGADHHTVARYVALRDAGRAPAAGLHRARLTDPFMEKIEEWVERSRGRIRADICHRKLLALGYQGSERTTRRAGRGCGSRSWTRRPHARRIDRRHAPPLRRGSHLRPHRGREDRDLDPRGEHPGPEPGDRACRPVLRDHVRHLRPRRPRVQGGLGGHGPPGQGRVVPTEANLLPAYDSFDALERACASFCREVNARPHRETRRPPEEMLASERAHLHPVPEAPYTAAFGQTRSVGFTSTISFGGVRYSVPHRLVGERVWVRRHGEEVVIVHVDPPPGRRRSPATRSPPRGGPGSPRSTTRPVPPARSGASPGPAPPRRRPSSPWGRVPRPGSWRPRR